MSKTIEPVIQYQKLSDDIKKNMTEEEKKEHIKKYKSFYYRTYYSNNKESYKERAKTYNDSTEEMRKEKRINKYNSNPVERARKSIYFFKKKYPEDEAIQKIINNKDIDYIEMVKQVKMYRITIKYI
tara:strand:- start:1647 stop:2027 length:381 start_codon:yes stop_codon:yes gene_type:complete